MLQIETLYLEGLKNKSELFDVNGWHTYFIQWLIMRKHQNNHFLSSITFIWVIQMSTLLTTAHASIQKCDVVVSPAQEEHKEIETQISQALLSTLAAELGIPRNEIEAKLKNVYDHYAVPVLIDNQLAAQERYEAGINTMRMARSVLRVGMTRDSRQRKIYDRLSLFDISVNEEIAFIDYTVVPTSPSRIFISEIKGDHHSVIRPLTRRLLQEVIARHPSLVTLSLEFMPADMFHINQAVRAGKSPEEAIQASPIYSALKAIGFSKIIKSQTSIAPDGPGMFIERP